MIRPAARAALLAGALLIAVPIVFPAATHRALAVELDQAELDRLETEGREWFQKSGDPDLSRKQRNEALREAYQRLREAWQTLNDFCDAHPDQIEAVDKRMVRINTLYYWVKKTAPLGVLNPRAPKAPKAPVAPANTEPPPAADASPAPEAKGPSDEPRAPTAVERARAHEQGRPGDLSGSMAVWLEALAGITDTASAEYAEALGRVATLQEELKQAYREIQDDDPDAIDVESEPGQEAVVADRLIEQLGSDDMDVRRRAASQLGALGHTPAASALYQAARTEKDTDVRGAVFDALVRLGGKRTCEALARFSRGRESDLAAQAVGALGMLGARDRVHARYAGLSLGDFVEKSKGAEVTGSAIRALRGLGAGGVPGLIRGLGTKDPQVELQVIGALGAAGDVRAAGPLSELLLAKGAEKRLSAARAALTQIGRPAVPALIDALRSRKTRYNAGILLYEITGETFGEDANKWAAWWRDNG